MRISSSPFTCAICCSYSNVGSPNFSNHAKLSNTEWYTPYGPPDPISVEGTPRCCKNGVKSDPLTRSPTFTSFFTTAFGLRESPPSALVTPRSFSRFSLAAFHCSYTLPPLGLGTACDTSRRYCFRLGTADAPKFGPATATSMLKYTTALRSSSACCSANSVEPIRPSSSASQLANTRVRFGFHPVFSNAPTPCTASSCAAVPLFGSTAPYTQASRWLPVITHWSGDSLPFTMPITS